MQGLLEEHHTSGALWKGNSQTVHHAPSRMHPLQVH